MAIGDQTVSPRLYTVGRGQIYFQESGAAFYTQLGNTPELGFTQSIEDLKHYSSRSGVNVLDASVVLQQDVSASFTLDEFKASNLRFFFMSTLNTAATQIAGAFSLTIAAAAQGGVYNLGAYNLSALTVSTTGGSPDWVLNTDYEVDLVGGILYITEASGISGISIDVTATQAATATNTVNAATATTFKGDFLFVGDPPIGARIKVSGYGSLKPSGDVPGISDDWMTMPFIIDFEENASYTGLIDVVNFGTVT